MYGNGAAGLLLRRSRTVWETDLEFIDTSIVRWESIDLAIDGIESVSELRESVRFAKEKVRRDIGKPTFLTVNFTGSGSMYHVLNNPEATQYWLESWREEEQGKYAFVMVDACVTWPVPR